LLSKHGRTVWLTADVATLWQRVQADPRNTERRPALTSASAIEEIVEVMRAREELYRSCADLTVCTQDRTPDQVAAEVVDGLRRFAAS
jgi:shikimate kinase